MNTSSKLIKLLALLFLTSIILGDGDITIKMESDLDSMRVLTKKSPERAIRFARALLKKVHSENPSKFDYRVHNSLGEIYLDLQMNGQAMSHFTEAKLIWNRMGKKTGPWLMVNIGNVYYQQEKYIRAREYYLDALDIFNGLKKNRENRLNGRKVSLSNLGRIEVKIKNYDRALDYFNEALDISLRSSRYLAFEKAREQNKIIYEGVASGVAYQHKLIASLYNLWGQYDLALEQSLMADSILKYIIETSSLSQNQPTIRYAKKNMGQNISLQAEINTKLRQFDDALIQIRTASQLLQNWPYAFVDHMEVESKFYFANEELYLALESLDRGLKVCDLEGLDIRKVSLLKNKLELLIANNLEKSALDIAKEINALSVNIQNERMASLFDDIEHKAELVLRKEQLTQSKENQVLISILLGVLLILLGTITLNLRSKKRYEAQQARISEQKQQLISHKLKIKENDLARMSTYIVSKNDLLNSIVSDLEYHTSLIENKKDRRLMTPLKKKILDKIDESADWDQFQVQFSSAYPEFIESLTSGYPNIRSGDIKLCCYLKMNMNTKDIAQVTGLSVRAIENKRYRLRKKLELDTHITLESFLHSVSNSKNIKISGNGVVK